MVSKKEFNIIEKMLKKKNFEKAIEECNNLLKKDLDSLVHFNLIALNLEVANHHKGAIALYKWILEQNPKFDQTWSKLSTSYFNGGDIVNALKSAEKAIELNQNDIEAWRTLGLIHHSNKKYEEAVDAFNRALEIDPNDPVIPFLRDQSANAMK